MKLSLSCMAFSALLFLLSPSLFVSSSRRWCGCRCPWGYGVICLERGGSVTKRRERERERFFICLSLSLSFSFAPCHLLLLPFSSCAFSLSLSWRRAFEHMPSALTVNNASPSLLYCTVIFLSAFTNTILCVCLSQILPPSLPPTHTHTHIPTHTLIYCVHVP